ncbi:peptidase S9, prolyl oligopeptidase active site domain protein [gamma proteobacterium NOR5-3]|nr:peptidase S9, prolyl oligopeptidase active site domain protein [gamma proteobacterium NOR5-3]
MLRFALLLGIFVSSAAVSDIRDEQFSIASILSSPFPTEIVAAPDTPGLAFVLNDRGVRNIWYAGGPGDSARQITAFTDDDGINVSDLKFTADGKRLVFIRGGSPNAAGELPNPASLTRGGEHAVYVIAVDGGEARKLDNGSGPSVHPSGGQIAYVNERTVWSIALDDPEAKPEALFQARGSIGSLAWSPDGSRLLFRSNRGTHSYIGVWTPDDGQGEIVWLSPSVDRDLSPTWSPDGRQLAFLRLPSPASDHFPFEPIREDLPWSIRVADPDTGTSVEVWRADKGHGSVHRGIEGGQQLFWSADDRLLFFWEKNGWNQLYSVAAKGGQPKHLTPGEFEIEYAALTSDRRSLVYASNQDDIHRRHLWQVDTGGGQPRELTSGDGIEWAPAPLADGGIAFLRSGATTPARAAVISRKGKIQGLATDTLPAGFPDDLVTPIAVEITATDGKQAPAQLFLPEGLEPGEKVPVAIFLHGGSRRQMLLGWHMRGYYHNAYSLSQYFASRGIIALALNYRSGIGYGMAFREALDYGATGNSEFRDVIGAGLFLRNHPNVDQDKITIWGGSYGGYLTAHALAQASEMFSAGVDIHGVHDWNDGIRIFVPGYNKNDFPEESAIADRSSPFHYIDGWRSPVLLIHGDDDRNVFFSQTTRLARKLREREVRVEQLVFPDEVHGFLLHRNWLKAYERTAEFLIGEMEN